MEAGKRSINDIFNGNRILEIPFFQRAYVWGEEQWSRFLEDMIHVSSTNKPYFLGSVILKQQITDTNSSVGDIRTIVDGQQRLTTLNIFFKAMCLLQENQATFDRVFRLINNDIALSHNHNDINSFVKVLNVKDAESVDEVDAITRAFNYFLKNIPKDTLIMQNVLTNIMFVGIDLGVDEDEQQIFDTINSLGVRLTTAELLKNYFFGRQDIDLYKTYWESLFEKDFETKEFWDREITTGRSKRSNIDLFFHSYLQIRIHNKSVKIKTEDKNVFTKVEGLFDSYKKFIEFYGVDKQELIRDIKTYADLYRNNIDSSVLDTDLSPDASMDRVNALIFGLENTTLIPYVLFVLKTVENESERNEIFGYIESYLMRRVVCKATSKNYNQLFSERFISNNLITKKDVQRYIGELSDKVNYMPTDSELQAGFNDSKLTNKQAAGVLYFIESKIRNRVIQSTSLLGLSRYSLEHVMPKKWENKWPEVKGEDNKVKRNRKLLTLGNLTIITSSLNSSIRDSSWDIKRKGKNGKGGLLSYSSGIETFHEYLSRDVWDEDAIENRAVFLYEKARESWRV